MIKLSKLKLNLKIPDFFGLHFFFYGTPVYVSCNIVWETLLQNMGVQNFYGKELHPFSGGAGSLAARGKIAVRGAFKHLNYCVTFIVDT
jgi:hypothetical protein